MRSLRLGCSLVCVILAVTAFGGLTPGPQVPDAPDRGATLGDFNGDGLTDHVYSSYFLINQGGGNFTKHHFVLPEPATNVIATMDVNGDGRSDLITEKLGFFPPGATQPRPPETYRLHIIGEQLELGLPIELGMGTEPHPVDIDGDGKDDLVYVEPTYDSHVPNTHWEHLYSTVHVRISRGDGTFAAREPVRIETGAPYSGVPLRRQTGDLNHDGILDMVMRGDQTLVILLGTTSGSFTISTRFLPSRLFGGAPFDLQDIDGDGNLDIVRSSNQRILYVFHGDGAGGFPRLTALPVPRVHEVIAPAYVLDGLGIDIMGPDLEFGQFVRSGRTEILAAMPEGDLVVYAWENKKLREVARSQTEFLIPEVHVGNYFESGKLGAYMAAHVSNNGWATPRVFNTSELMAPAIAEVSVSGRSRAVRGFVSGPATEFEVQMSGDACTTTLANHWTLSRDGLFGFTPDRSVELVHPGDNHTADYDMAVRFTAPWAADPVVGYLKRKGRDYVGTAYAKTACGSSHIEMIVTPR